MKLLIIFVVQFLNKNQMKKIYLLALILASTLSFGQVTLPHYESFNYTVGSALGGQGTWVNVNTGDEVLVEAGNLSYTGLAASTGNSVIFEGAGIDPQIAFTTQTSGIVYASFILKVTNIAVVTDPNAGYSLGFADTSTNFASTVWIKPLGAGFQIGLNKATAIPDTQYVATELALNTNHLIVIAYDLGTTKSASVWINPAPLTLGLALPPASTLNTTVGTTDRAQLQRFFLRQDSVAETAGVVVDEVRIGLSWSSVTPSNLSRNDFNAIAGLSIYPNPANTVLNITSDSFTTKTVEIYNTLGAKVLATQVTNAPVNVAGLTTGIYMVKVTEEGKTATRKLVIE